MRRLAGWGARILRYAGKIAELLAWIGFALATRDSSGSFPEFWTETRRGWLKGVRGWFRSTIIATPFLWPIAAHAFPDARAPHWFGAVLASVCIFGALSAVIAPIAVHSGRALGARRPFYDMAATSVGTGLAGFVLCLRGGSASPWLVILPWLVGAVWGWLYWFFAYRPRPPYLSEDT